MELAVGAVEARRRKQAQQVGGGPDEVAITVPEVAATSQPGNGSEPLVKQAL